MTTKITGTRIKQWTIIIAQDILYNIIILYIIIGMIVPKEKEKPANCALFVY